MIQSLRFLLRVIIALCALLTVSSSHSQTTVFNDDFSTSQGVYYTTAAGLIGTSTIWRNARSGSDFGSGIANSHLSLINDTGGTANSNGWVMGYTNSSDFPMPYNTILANNPGMVAWTFNMRQSNSNPSGFAATEYGMAYILAGTAGTTNVTGTGYAVVLGNTGTADPVRLVRYNSGIRNHTNLISSSTSGLADFGAQYISVKVIYTPSTNTWQLLLRNDGTTTAADPNSGTLASQGTIVNNTYTSSSLPILGGYQNAGTLASQTAFFDYVRVTVGIPTLISLSPSSRTAGTAAFEMVITGSGFTNTTTARWNGTNRSTAYDSPTQLRVAITAADISVSGSASVTVANGTTVSNALPFAIEPAGIPTLTVSTNALNFATTTTGTASAALTYAITGSNLTADPVIVAPANFEISKDGGTAYASSFTLARTGNNLTGGTVTINARVKAAAPAGIYSGAITHNVTGGIEKQVAVTGKVLAAQPTIQSTAISFTSVSSSGFTVSWTNGNGARRIVLIRQAGAVNAAPVDGQGYNALSIFGSGSEIGTGNYAIYSGTGNSVAVTGLSPALSYHVAVYEYNGTGGTENYLTASPLLGNRTTLNATFGWQIYAANTVNTINFDSTVDGVNRDTFQGDGISPNSETGHIDSRAWAITGFSDGPIAFGSVNAEDGDYDRGVSEGGVSDGGMYAFETEPGNFSLGIQPATGDFAPGTITLRVQNQTGSAMTSINLGYKVYVRNDQPVSSSFGMSYSTDNASYTTVAGANVISPAPADATPGWKAYYRVVTFPISVAANSYCYLRWSGATVSGAGEADEFALDDIVLVANPSNTFAPFSGSAESFAVLGNATLAADLTVASDLAFNGGKLAINGKTLTLNGTVVNTTIGGLTGSSLSNLVMGGNASTALSFDQASLGTTNALNSLTISTFGLTITSIVSPVAVNGALAINSDQVLDMGTNALSGTLSSINLNGMLQTQNTSAVPIPSGKIWDGSGTVHYNAATAVQTIAAGTYSGLTVSSTGGASAGGALAVNGTLNLPSANPSATSGSLSLGSYTLLMGGNSTNTGIGDVTGTITRNNIVANKTYTFGHANTSIVFPNVGVLPTTMGLSIKIGTVPTWKAGAISRTYDFIQSGGSGTKAVIQAHYLDSELNGNAEAKLVDFAYIVSSSTVLEQGRSNYNTAENWIELTNVNVGLYFTNTFGQIELTLDEMASGFLTWNGLQGTSWTTALNWTPNATPSDNTAVLIPDAALTPNDPLLNSAVLLGSLTIDSGGILNAPDNSQFTINSASGAWINNGTFNPGLGTSRVIFTNLDATIAGQTTFNNISINSGAGLRPLTGNVMRIAGEFSRLGNFSAGSIDNTVEYAGTNQTMATLTGSLAAYNNLIISGTGAIFPAALNITGDLTVNNNVNFSGKTVTMNGSKLQAIGGTASPAFDNLVISNTDGGVSLAASIAVSGTLTLSSGVLSINSRNLTLGANPVAGTFDVSRMIAADGSGEVRRPFSAAGTYFFPIGERTSNPAYSPIAVAITSGSFSNAHVGVSVADAVHPDNHSTQNYISRYWKVSQSGITGAVATVTANYVPAEVLVPESSMAAAQLVGNFDQAANPWKKFAPLADNTLTAAGALLPAGQTSFFTGLKAGDFTALLTGYGAFCKNASAVLSATLAGGDGPYAYSWSGGLGTGATASVPTAAVGDTNYTVTVRDANGFVAADTAAVTVLAASLGGALTGPQYICMGSKPNDIQLSGQTGDVIYWQRDVTEDFLAPTNISNTTSVLSGEAVGPLSATAYFRAVISNGSCGEVYSLPAAANIKTTTWNGTAWSAGAPDGSTNAILSGTYAVDSDMTACSLLINSNASVTIESGAVATLHGALLVDSGSLSMEDSSSLVQTDDDAVNSGTDFALKRNAQPMYRYDYTYWSSPVAGLTLYSLSPGTLADKYFGWDPNAAAWVLYGNGNHVMAPGTGYIVRAPQSYSTDPATLSTFTGIFSGKPHNGKFSVPVIGSNAFNLLGNPYPSALSADDFLTDPANSGVLDGTLYFWTHNSPPAGSGGGTYNYSPDDFALYNLAGAVGTAAPSEAFPDAGNTPTGLISSGQAFFVRCIAPGMANFSNSMRTGESNSQFFRASGNAPRRNFEKHRLWLSASNSQSAYKQMLVAYAAGATASFDRGLDGEFHSESGGLALYTLGAGKQLSIQSLGLPFDASSTVPVGFRSNAPGSCTIAIDRLDGLFESQQIFLHDKDLGLYHDLKASPYIFATAAGIFEDRFEIAYRNGPSLGTGEFDSASNSIIAFKEGGAVKVVSSRSRIIAVEVSDIQGRIIYRRKGLDGQAIVLDGLTAARQVLIINVTTEQNRKTSRKIVF